MREAGNRNQFCMHMFLLFVFYANYCRNCTMTFRIPILCCVAADLAANAAIARKQPKMVRLHSEQFSTCLYHSLVPD